MIVSELLAILEEMNPEAEVLLAIQPEWPLAFEVNGVADQRGFVFDSDDDEADEPDDENAPVWISTGGHPYHRSPYAPRQAWDCVVTA